MTLEQAIERLCFEYGLAIMRKDIRNPLAYALYQVWKVADKEGVKKNGRA